MKKRGDTLVEVMFSVGIFGMIAVGAIALMNRGVTTAQNSLETSMARQEIDAQVEALRFIHDAYLTESRRADSVYRPIWYSLTANAYRSNDNLGGILLEDSDFYTRVIENNKTCAEVYNRGYPDKSFVINPRKLDSATVADDTIVYYDDSDDPILRPASIYPRLLYVANPDTAELSDVTVEGNRLSVHDNATLTAAEGIWVTAIVSDTGITDSEGFKPDFYDFYIQTCWEKAAGDGSTSINTILRLYNADQIAYDIRTRTSGFELVYDANGGSGAPTAEHYDDITYPRHTFTLSDVVPVRSGYRFLGWSTDPDAMSGSYSPGGSITVYQLSTVLYAIWEAPRSFTLNYNANGGSGAPIADTYGPTFDTSHAFTVKAGAPTRSGYNFLGWTETANGTGTVYSAGDTLPATSNASQTIYAKWQQLYTHTLKYDNNDGSGVSKTDSVTDSNASHTFTIRSDVPARSGYEFLGWYENTAGTGSKYSAGGTISVDSEKTLYAKWRLITYSYTLNYNLNGGSGTFPAQAYTGAETSHTFTIKTPNPTRSDYNFLGWADSAGATSATYTSSITMSPGSRTIYAVWEHINMQNFSCSSINPGAVLRLEDKRDGNYYDITRLGTGECWMREDLRFTGTTLDPSSSDVTERKTLTWFSMSSMDDCYPYYENFNHACYYANSGIYYNFAAATAGTFARPDLGNSSAGVGLNLDVEQSICPRGWKLPTGNQVDFLIDTSTAKELNLVASIGGYYIYSSSTYQDRGYKYIYWTRTVTHYGQNKISLICDRASYHYCHAQVSARTLSFAYYYYYTDEYRGYMPQNSTTNGHIATKIRCIKI